MSSASPERPARAIGRVAGWSALIYSLLMASPLLWGAFKGDAISVVGALVAATWTASPAYGAALCAIATRTRAGAGVFLGVELLIMAWFGWVWIDTAILHPSSTGGFIYLSLPLFQWAGLVLVIAVAALTGWRARENWPDEPPVP